VHLVDGLLNRFFVVSPCIVAIHPRYRNQLGKERVPVVAMTSLPVSLLESGFHEIADELTYFAGHPIGPSREANALSIHPYTLSSREAPASR
jgi:hypothetical protein